MINSCVNGDDRNWFIYLFDTAEYFTLMKTSSVMVWGHREVPRGSQKTIRRLLKDLPSYSRSESQNELELSQRLRSLTGEEQHEMVRQLWGWDWVAVRGAGGRVKFRPPTLLSPDINGSTSEYLTHLILFQINRIHHKESTRASRPSERQSTNGESNGIYASSYMISIIYISKENVFCLLLC